MSRKTNRQLVTHVRSMAEAVAEVRQEVFA